jgi:hypothetical protein
MMNDPAIRDLWAALQRCERQAHEAALPLIVFDSPLRSELDISLRSAQRLDHNWVKARRIARLIVNHFASGQVYS